MEKLKWYFIALINLGIPSLVRLQFQKIRMRFGGGVENLKLTSKYACFPLYCRPRTSDLMVFHQIFVDREYRCLDHLKRADFIIDCGANVGYSAAYMLTAFPQARLVAIEPDSDNLMLLEENLAPYGDRVTIVKAAVWSHATDLVFDSAALGEGQEWGRQVKEGDCGESTTLKAVDLNTLLEQSGCDRISILKMDIEGAEVEVFAKNYSNWLGKVDNIVIELHGDQCEQVFESAIVGQNFEIATCDELTVCQGSGL
jgi:FkbM family methyltransferase